MDGASSFDAKIIVQVAWIAVIALCIVASAFSITVLYAIKKAPANFNPSFTLLRWFEHAVTLHMITVILIVVATSFLALFGVINPNGVVGILSGIAGYVLGGLKKESPPAGAEQTGKTATGPRG
jgi:hypothetical protein